MPRKKQSKGSCNYCGREMTRGGLARHLPDCLKRQEAIASANKGTGREQPIYHLQVQDAYDGAYWLHLEMNGLATLAKLDHYLRAIWLECCGHLSQFSLEGWRSPEISMSKTAESLFRPGMQLTHIYDFGTSSETLVKVVGVRKGRPTTKHPIALMARNAMPEAVCMECGEPATRLCIECIQEYEGPTGELCEEHAASHPHDDYGPPMDLVNSPRTGMCGYEGPAVAPY